MSRAMSAMASASWVGRKRYSAWLTDKLSVHSILEMTATTRPAITGTEARDDNAAGSQAVDLALRRLEPQHLIDLDTRGGQQIVDMPAQSLGLAQMPRDSRFQSSFGAAGVDVIPGRKIKHTQLTDLDRELHGNANQQLIGRKRHNRLCRIVAGDKEALDIESAPYPFHQGLNAETLGCVMPARVHVQPGFLGFMPVVFAHLAGDIGVEPFLQSQGPISVGTAGDNPGRSNERVFIRRCEQYRMLEHAASRSRSARALRLGEYPLIPVGQR